MSDRFRRTVEYQGQTMTLIELSDRLGVCPETLWYRVTHGKVVDAKAHGAAVKTKRTGARRIHGPRPKRISLFDNALRYTEDLRAQIAVGLAEARGSGLTLDEISECMGLSRERVRQIEKHAMRKIKIRAMRDGADAEVRDALRYLDSIRGESNADRFELEASGFDADEGHAYRAFVRSQRRLKAKVAA